MPTNTDKPSRRRGRPSRKEEMERALAEIGIDPTLVSPLRILAAIAANGRMPPTARVAACKVLLGVRDEDPAEDSAAAGSDMAERAIKLMAAARKAH